MLQLPQPRHIPVVPSALAVRSRLPGRLRCSTAAYKAIPAVRSSFPYQTFNSSVCTGVEYICAWQDRCTKRFSALQLLFSSHRPFLPCTSLRMLEFCRLFNFCQRATVSFEERLLHHLQLCYKEHFNYSICSGNICSLHKEIYVLEEILKCNLSLLRMMI